MNNNKSILNLNEEKLHRILKESIEHVLLNEKTIDDLYHYINAVNLIKVLKNNRLYTCTPERYFTSNGKFDGFVDGPNQRFISLTRNKNGQEGYPVLKYTNWGDGEDHFVVRLDIDGNFFNQGNIKHQDKRRKQGYKRINTKIRPMDWAYYAYGQGKGDPHAFANDTHGVFAHNGKEWQMQSNAFPEYYYPIDADTTDVYNHPMSQAEERLTTTSKFIPHANKFIKCIDIFVSRNIDGKDFNILRQVDKLAKQRNIQVNFYDNFDYFSRQYENEAFSLDGVAMMIWN